MGWFEEQLKLRKQQDEEILEEAFFNIAGSVTGKVFTKHQKEYSELTKDALFEVMRYYHLKKQSLPAYGMSLEEQMDALLRPNGIMHRTVSLGQGWYQDAIGAMLGFFKEDGSVVALLPGKLRGYTYRDPLTGNQTKIGKANEDLFASEAIAFYLPFPLKKMGLKDLARYIWGIFTGVDYLLVLLVSLLITLLGMITPRLYQHIFSEQVLTGQYAVMAASLLFLLSLGISTMLFSSVKGLLNARVNTKLNVSIEAATMMRILSLPADFFKKYSAGELAQRVSQVSDLCDNLVDTVLQMGITSLFSLLYVIQIFRFTKALVLPSVLVIAATLVVSIFSSLIGMRRNREKMELASKESGMSYALISGIQKIKLAGAEKRAFARWGNLYAKQAKIEYSPSFYSVLQTAIGLVGNMVIYFIAIQKQISVADYYAFNVAYGMVIGTFGNLSILVSNIAAIRPTLEMVQPILEQVPEIAEKKQVLKKLSGGIELSHVSFRYQERMPLVLEDISLKIRPGQYVAIVGKTGCGKSTLLRLLLGFEKPQKGAIYYDGKDLDIIDVKSLRKNIGVVMQNAKLFSGDIYSNIAISNPNLTMEEAWEAASFAGLAEDIEEMPMGMYTMISEGGGGISGGQRQRLMIARAIASKPSILLFDEATSALDNLTQKRVSDSLDQLHCTRLVIAHRLSTIQHCDRIIVLDKGKIVEDGTYQELMAKDGFFAELVKRQQVDS